MVRNKVKLIIGNAEYTLLTEDDTKYVTELGKEVEVVIPEI